MLALNDNTNFGCQLRDGLYSALSNRLITWPVLRARLKTLSIPKEYHGDILQMVHYRQYDRITDPIEQLLEKIVIKHIIEELINS
jgi:hypothetical protein